MGLDISFFWPAGVVSASKMGADLDVSLFSSCLTFVAMDAVYD